MRIAAIFITAVALLALALDARGRISAAGRQAFDEMAGILPYPGWYAGLAMAAAAVVLRMLLPGRGRR